MESWFDLGCVGMAQAQQPSKIPRRFLSTASLSSLSPRLDAFRQGLKELGYVEGKNITIEYRSAEGNEIGCRNLRRKLAARLKVDCFVTAGSSPTRAAMQAPPAPFRSSQQPLETLSLLELSPASHGPVGNIHGADLQLLRASRQAIRVAQRNYS